ncbi:splicing factor C9orf78-like [Watersipora subatra]|uniref:splicing factor C9orf78-like n=1 Tax=Watersipora subatra TaxID=2589382 RepID=UPI00355B30A0
MSAPPAIKKIKKQRAVRKRKDSDEESEGSDDVDAATDLTSLDELKALQKMRKRPKGISLAGLATGKAVTNVAAEVELDADPFKIKTGGFIDMKKNKRDKRLSSEEAIGTAFAAETNTRDEDAEMQKYVDHEIARRKGLVIDDPSANSKTNDPESVLYQLPEHLKAESTILKTEDMLSNQMLSGIPEVDLGIAAKIRNIEATEDAKQKLMIERMKKKDEVSHFVPTNMAVNFVQHDRYKVDSSMLPQVSADKSKDEKTLQKFKANVARR